MLCSRQESHALTRKYFLSAYCVPGLWWALGAVGEAAGRALFPGAV